MSYDVLVMAAGSVARTLPIPGLAEHGIGFKNVGEAIYLRNHVLARLDAASSTDDPAVRQRALTFTFVGGGYAGVEAFAELEDMARYAIEHYYPRLSPSDMRWVLVEAMGRILPEVDLDMAAWTVKQLTARDMDVRLNTRLESISDDGVVRLSDGEEFPTETLVWTAGTKPNPMLAETDLPVDGRGRVECEATLQVPRDARRLGGRRPRRRPRPHQGRPGATTAPNAQHAVRQAKRLADNIVAVLAGEQPVPYRHEYAGSVASLGLHKGVAQVYGVKLKGWPAWFMHRTLPRQPGADLQPQGPGGRRLDAGLAVPPRGRLPRAAAGPAPGVRVRRQHRPRRAPPAGPHRPAGGAAEDGDLTSAQPGRQAVPSAWTAVVEAGTIPAEACATCQRPSQRRSSTGTPACAGRHGQPDGVGQQDLLAADVHHHRRETAEVLGERGELGRGQVGAGREAGGAAAQPGRAQHRVGAVGGPLGARQVQPGGDEAEDGGQRGAGVAEPQRRGEGEPAAGRVAGQRGARRVGARSSSPGRRRGRRRGPPGTGARGRAGSPGGGRWRRSRPRDGWRAPGGCAPSRS